MTHCSMIYVYKDNELKNVLLNMLVKCSEKQ